MNCIFCGQDSSRAKSVEHIIPESLGNLEYILNRGYVCDQCNNYFAVKIEQPLLEMPYFKQFRHDLNISNKRERTPSKSGFIIDPDLSEVKFHKHKIKGKSVELDQDVLKELASGRYKEIPAFTVVYGIPAPNIHISRFLGKIGIEALAYSTQTNGDDDFYYNQECLNNIKRYVRRAEKNEMWNYGSRQLYKSDTRFKDSKGEMTIICGWEFITTETGRLFFQFLFMGAEFTIDMLSPDIDEMQKWDKETNKRSFVYDSLVKRLEE
jgi:hypothetical protein